MRTNLQPSGPHPLYLLRHAGAIRSNPLTFLLKWQQTYGDVVALPFKRRTFLLNAPTDIKHVLVTNHTNYHKTGGILVGKRLFGRGLLSSEDPLHKKQRKIIQPIFHHQNLSHFSDIIVSTTADMIDTWQEERPVDLSEEMMRTTLKIIGKALFSTDLVDEAPEFGKAFTTCQRYITQKQRSMLPIPERIPTPRNLSYRSAIRQLDEMIDQMISDRRASAAETSDLLSMLIAARYDDGTAMSPKQIRDEVLIFLLAGHETTSNALSWTWYLLSKHPQAELRVVEEVNKVLDGRLPQITDLPNLSYSRMVLAEAMRLYPPVWIIARRSLIGDTLPSGVTIPPQANVAMSQYVAHRNPRYFSNPECFIPERFCDHKGQEHPTYSYFPFGRGVRSCIGEQFSKIEAILMIATIIQKCRFTLVPGQVIEPEPLITIRPKHGLLMKVKKQQG